MIEADNFSYLMNGHLVHGHQFLHGLEVLLGLEHVLLLVNMQLRVVRLCADVLSGDMMLTDESSDLTVCHVVFGLHFLTAVPFCQFWSGILLDEITVYAGFWQAFLVPKSEDFNILCFGNAIYGCFLYFVFLYDFINRIEGSGILDLLESFSLGVSERWLA